MTNITPREGTTMGPKARCLLAASAALPLLLGCGGGRHLKAPIRTSLGTLVSVEERRSVETYYTSAATLTAGSGEVLLVLSFEGAGPITFEGKAQHDGPNRLPLADAAGAEFWPAFAGTPTRSGVISGEGWRLDGQLVFPAGATAPAFQGTVTLPEPKLTLVYRVPTSATGLVLVDGDQRYPLD
jgi:hypothetical protein